MIEILVITTKGVSKYKIPNNIYEKCSFDKNGLIVGIDYVDQYLREIYHIWCEDWYENIDNQSVDKKINKCSYSKNNTKSYP